MKEVKLSPSIFAADIVNLKQQLAILERNDVDLLHVDVMDGMFVNRIAFGADHIRMLKQSTQIPLDVHLMVVRPERYIESVIDAGADLVTVHQESTTMLYHCLELIKRRGKKAGVVLSPATSPATIQYVMDIVDMVLVMTVNPGEGKQCFSKDMLPKIGAVKDMIDGKCIDIEVDGSIDDHTAMLCQQAGANIFVSGGYVFGAEIEKRIQRLQQVLGVQRGDLS